MNKITNPARAALPDMNRTREKAMVRAEVKRRFPVVKQGGKKK